MLEILVYYSIGALVSWIYSWIIIYPIAIAKAKEYAIITLNLSLFNKLTMWNMFMGSLIGNYLTWWAVLIPSIINPKLVSETLFINLIGIK